MGQGKSSIINAKLYNPAEYDELNTFNEDRYGQMKLLVNKATQQKYAEISKTLNDESVLEKRVEELSFRSLLEHPNLIKLLSFNSQKKDEFCSSFYKLGLFYEFYSNNLRTEIQERQKVNAAYREGELWYILESLLSVVFYLKTKTVTHGDIRPYNLIVTPEGTIKLGEIFIHSQPLSSYSQLLHNSLDELYISPQLYRSLKEYKITPVFDANKSEVYSIGMTVLEAATLENVSKVCYDRENYTIKSEEVNRLLNQVRTQYSYPLYTFLQKLLIEEEQDRASVEDLITELNQSFVQTQITKGISTIEIISQQVSQVQGGAIEETTYVEEKVVRSANPARESHVQEKQITYEAPAYTTTTYTTTNYQNDDLNARIQAVLAMSRETIQKYGSSNLTYSSTTPAATYTASTYTAPATYTAPTTTYTAPVTYTTTTTAALPPTYTTYTTNYNAPIDAKASQIETRTYLNENTNNIETKNYSVEPIVEDVVKRSKKETTDNINGVTDISASYAANQNNQYNFSVNPEVYTTTTTYQQPASAVNYTTTTYQQPASAVNYTTTTYQQPATEVNYSSTYVPTTTNYNQTTTYVPSYSQTTYTNTTPLSGVTQNVTEYQTTSSLNFKSAEEREAYIAKLIADAKSTYNASNTQVTYTTYVDGNTTNVQTATY